MTYDELYDHVLHYVALPHTTITVHDQRRACLILGAFMEFILDCQNAGIDLNTIDLNDIVNVKLDDVGDQDYIPPTPEHIPPIEAPLVETEEDEDEDLFYDIEELLKEI